LTSTARGQTAESGERWFVLTIGLRHPVPDRARALGSLSRNMFRSPCRNANIDVDVSDFDRISLLPRDVMNRDELSIPMAPKRRRRPSSLQRHEAIIVEKLRISLEPRKPARTAKA